MSTAAQPVDELVAVPRAVVRVIPYLHGAAELAVFWALCWASFGPEPGPMPWIPLPVHVADVSPEDVSDAITAFERIGLLETRDQELRLCVDTWAELGGRRKR